MSHLLDFVLHLDKHLSGIIAHYGAVTYVILFCLLFAETGFVITPFLPGDSLLFASGALASAGAGLNVWLLAIVFLLGAILGDSANYAFGKHLGRRMPFLSAQKREWTEAFFQKHGPKTIVIARFVPVVRTFAPFVAGTGRMHYGLFLRYNVAGALLWVALLLCIGYFFGNLSFMRGHFGLVIVAIVVISLLPVAWEWFATRGKGEDRNAAQVNSNNAGRAAAPRQES